MNIRTAGAALRQNGRLAALFSGPLSFGLVLLFLHPEGMSDPARAALAVTAWVALWWITEAVEIEVTALLPLVLLPLTGAMKIGPSAQAYGNPLVFLYLAGFVLAIAIERWELHRRIALHIILAIGTGSRQLVLGFMLATAVISMWISNTATALMMMPIAMAVIRQFSKTDALGKLIPTPFSQALVLGVAYAASIGGMATMIGTPPNLVFAGVVRETYGIEFSFVQWMIAALPLASILLLLTWYYLVHAGFKVGADVGIGSSDALREQLRSLGPMQPEEKRVLAVFTCAAVAWIIRGFVLQPLIPALDDTIVGLLGALALFFIPAPSQPGERLMNWKHAVKMPWGILLIFGGGLALADS
ncbi:MAG: anion transporter, partial [Bacteroidetes bacterium]